ncbi:hypothetical protein GGQ08_002541 [Salinibacter ruber]|uniref:hypothetical protein n=1 Tax=Salinibacter ruber TaxID=146919 RepID=UPI002169C196|nr:hypothetical protein [Salinibacter ruber]MCS3651607.1 hypothetical protein [Salinibacter ruber]MCS3654465.1 hypothetical protein [Salinibacter ruber]
MSNPSTDPAPGDFPTSSGAPFEDPDPSSWDQADEMEMPGGLSSSLATDMARSWVRQHQKATMIGAFGVGVFVGVMLRD